MSSMSGQTPTDLPWDTLIERADAAIESGGTVYFKFTCYYCGARQTFDKPNSLYTTGSCQECGHVTDIKLQGGGFMLVMALGGQ